MDVRSELVRYKGIYLAILKNVSKRHSFAYFSLAVKRKVMSPKSETSISRLNQRLDELDEQRSNPTLCIFIKIYPPIQWSYTNIDLSH
jgi:hypothetical protein